MTYIIPLRSQIRLLMTILSGLLIISINSCRNKDSITPKTAKSSDNSIATFAFNGLTPSVSANINGTNITATVPAGTNLTTLVPTITLPAGATVSPASGVAQNFTNPVNYVVTAEDETKQTYVVTVSTQGITIGSFAPTSGGASTPVVINGSGFSNISTDNNVTINGVNAVITVSRSDQITIQIPERAGSGKLVVAVGSKQATSSASFTYQYQISSNTTLHTANDFYQSLTIDPDDGTVYASRRNASGLLIIKPNNTKQLITLRDNLGSNHTVLTGIAIVKSGITSGTFGSEFNKTLFVTNEAKGVYFYGLSNITGATTILNAYSSPFQLNDAIFNAPTSIAGVSQSPTNTNPLNGTYYLACFGNSTIVRSTRLNGVTQSPVIVGSPGSAGFNTGSVSSVNAKFRNPVGVFFRNNLLYVADEGNHAIRAIDYNAGTVSTLVGNGTAGNTDGAFSAVRLNLPANVVVDNSGLIYVTDRGNGRLRVFDPRSQTSQTLLTGLNAPYGLAIDNAGTLYLGEWSGSASRILKLTVR